MYLLSRLLILAILVSFGFKSFGFSESTKTNSIKFSQLLSDIESYYVENRNDTLLTESAIKALLKNLDPHSVYFTKKELQKSQEPLDGKFDGVGIQFNIFKDTLLVVTPLPGGPSEKVGIFAGDKIIKVDTTQVAGVGLTNRQVFKLLRGEKGSIVTLYIKRDGVSELLSFTVTRDAIPIHSVVSSYIINDHIGYIKIVNFSKSTIQEFDKAISKLKEGGMKKLIIDLQNNGGGYLHVATQLASRLIENNQLIVYTEGRKSSKKNYNSSNKGVTNSNQFRTGDLIILINEASASASEILSGAIQDYDRGLIIGRRSFGKGLVQKTFKFIDGSAMRLTVSRYYTPSGRCIQKSYEKGVDKYREELYERYKNGEVYKDDQKDFPDSLKFKTLNSKRIVFGGGGISPDYLVPIDTSMYSGLFSKIRRRGLINEVGLSYANKNRKTFLRKYNNIESFLEDETINDKLIKLVKKGIKKKKLKLNEKELAISKSLIILGIKSSIANSIFGIEESYKVTNQMNNPLKKALEILSSEQSLEIK